MIYVLSLIMIASILPFETLNLGWEFSLYSRDFIIATISIIAAYETDWNKVKVKTLILVNAVLQSTTAFCSPLSFYLYHNHNIDIPYWTTFVVIMFASLWALTQYIKHIKKNSDTIDQEHYFYGLYLPKGFNGVWQCLFGRVYSGVCIYGDGHVWRFRRGKMVKCRMRDVENKEIIWVNTHVKNDRHFDVELDKLIGCKWKWHSNCFDKLQIFQPINKLL